MAQRITSKQRYGRLETVERLENRNGHERWKCQCDCGNTTEVYAANLLAEQTQSCGCIARELLAEKNYRHGLSRTKLYNRWKCIKQRCYRPKDKCYSRYGGRGIKVCDEWRDDFKAFHDWAMANGYADNLQIDRIDNDGDYSPENCRWVTCKVNQNNRGNSKKSSQSTKEKEHPHDEKSTRRVAFPAST